MYQINENHLELSGSYLFLTIVRKIAAFTGVYQDERVTRVGIGDAMKPFYPAVVQTLHETVGEMGEVETLHSYGPEDGYVSLRDKMVESDYKVRGVEIRSDEIFIPDGAKSDPDNIQETFSLDSTVTVCNPIYPVYLDTNMVAGRSSDYDAAKGIYTGITYLPCTVENNFTPAFLAGKASNLIYLCSPSNPAGTVMRKEALQRWADYTSESDSVILFDAAREAYITEADVPYTIYECEGTRTCAIGPHSSLKRAGFTGLHLGATVVSHNLRKKVKHADGTAEEVELYALWSRRHGTKFSDASYIVQRMGEAVYSAKGQWETTEQVAYYMRNAYYMYETLKKIGFSVYGGVNTSYVWVKTPGDMTSQEFFDTLLEKTAMVGMPGSGFGPHGEHYSRFSVFGTYEDTVEAMVRTQTLQL